MSAQRKHATQWTIEEYLDFENGAADRHEFFEGEVHAMAGSSRQHNRISLNIAGALQMMLRGKLCSVQGMDQRLQMGAADLLTYPDVMVICPPERPSKTDSIAVADATVIIEVLSPSTAQYDRTSKFEFYSLLPSFRHYLLIDQSRVEVEHRFRETNGSWGSQIFRKLDDKIELTAIDCTLSIREIYEEIEF